MFHDGNTMGFTLVVICSMLFSPLAITGVHALDCSNPQVTLEMKMCAQEAYKAADGDLNADYKMARDYFRALDENFSGNLKGAAKTLLKAQRIWIKYRDAQCHLEGFSFRGGTMEGLMVLTCLEHMTRQRSEILRSLVEQN